MNKLEKDAIELTKLLCLECRFNKDCKDKMKEFLHIKRYIKIRTDGLPAKERCPIFNHKSSPIRKKH